MNSSAPMPLLVEPPPTAQATSAPQIEFHGTQRVHTLGSGRRFCMNPQLQTHRYDHSPNQSPGSSGTRMVPRTPGSDNPTLASIMNTVAQAQARKRQRDEAMYPRRSIGQQTGADEEYELLGEESVSMPKRVRVRDTPSHEVTTESIGCNTSPSPDPTGDEPGSSDSPSTSSTQDERRRVFRSRLRERESQMAHRFRRMRRVQQETMRIMEAGQLQQINGLVPQSDCETRCPHSTTQFFNQYMNNVPMPPPTGPNAVSPTIAPGAMLHGNPLSYNPFWGHQFNAYAQQLTQIPAAPPALVCPLLTAQLPQPAPQPPTLHVPVAIRPASFPYPSPSTMHALFNLNYQINSNDYVAGLNRNQNQAYIDYMDRVIFDQRQLIINTLDIDMPIAATKHQVATHTTLVKYAKKEEEDTCTVCLNEFEDGEDTLKLRCEHLFHPNCITKWLEINKKCPMCRKDIDAVDESPASPCTSPVPVPVQSS